LMFLCVNGTAQSYSTKLSASPDER
jgi:hypothetical protein